MTPRPRPLPDRSGDAGRQLESWMARLALSLLIVATALGVSAWLG